MHSLIRAVAYGLLALAALTGCNMEGERRGDPQTLRKLDAALDRFLDREARQDGAIGAVAYVDDQSRSVTWSAARGLAGSSDARLATVNTPFRIASITKTFVAAATLKLVEQRRFELDAPVSTLLSAETLAALVAGGADPAAITVRQLLGHRSGLFDYAATPEYFEAVGANPRRRWSRLEQLQLALTITPPAAAETVYAYSDTNYILLGEILERATGRNLAAALRATLDYERLGLRRTWLETLEPAPPNVAARLHQRILGVDTFDFDPSFDLWGGGGLVSTVTDIGRFYRALFEGRVVSKPLLLEMTQAVSGGGFGDAAYALGLMPFYLGNAECFGHEGLTLAVAAYCPTLKTTVVVTQVNNDHPGLELGQPQFVRELVSALGVSTRATPYGADFRRARCTPEIAASAVTVDCGMLAVSESRGNAASRPIELAVVIARHPTIAATLDPLLVLGGGPGDPLFPDVPLLLSDRDVALPIVSGQNVVFVEQRGVGASRPALVCPGPLQGVEAAQACVAALTSAGVDLGAYNSLASAADMETLRENLGATRWNLLGFSYGTRLALTMARERPASVASLSLDGVFPPETNNEDDAPRFAAVLDDLLMQCAGDTACSTAFPALRERFLAALTEFNATPVVVEGQALRGVELVNVLSNFQTRRELIEYVPAVVDAIARRDLGFLSALLASGQSGDSPIAPSTFSDAMFYSVHCNEENSFSDRAAIDALASDSNPVVAAIAAASVNNADICDVWPSGRAPARENEPVLINVPVLVLNGEFDLQTPPVAGRLAAASWPRSQIAEFRGTGHVTTKQVPECALSLVQAFQRKGSATRVDDRCLADIPSPTWRTSLDAGFYALLSGG